MNEPKHKIGEELKDTCGFGDVKVTDVFYSKTSETYVYQVYVIEGGSYMITDSFGLEPA